MLGMAATHASAAMSCVARAVCTLGFRQRAVIRSMCGNDIHDDGPFRTPADVWFESPTQTFHELFGLSDDQHDRFG